VPGTEEKLCDTLREESIGVIADRLHQTDKSQAHSVIHKKAESSFQGMAKARGVRNVVSGKRLISRLSDACKKRYGVSFGAMSICKEMQPNEFDPFLTEVVKGIAK